jgi:hypothetical protein
VLLALPVGEGAITLFGTADCAGAAQFLADPGGAKSRIPRDSRML